MNQAYPFEDCKRILAALPDDGTDRRLIDALLREKSVTRVDTTAVRAVAALQEATSRRGRLPEAVLARLVTVIARADDADELFDFVRRIAEIDRPGGGILLMDRLAGATPFRLPEGLPYEGV